MPSLQQVGTRWRPAREAVRRTINLHCPRARAAAPLTSHPPAVSCTIMSMEYPYFGQRTSSSTDIPMWRSVSLTCCWVPDGAAFAHTNASRHVSFKAHMSLTASIRSLPLPVPRTVTLVISSTLSTQIQRSIIVGGQGSDVRALPAAQTCHMRRRRTLACQGRPCSPSGTNMSYEEEEDTCMSGASVLFQRHRLLAA